MSTEGFTFLRCLLFGSPNRIFCVDRQKIAFRFAIKKTVAGCCVTFTVFMFCSTQVGEDFSEPRTRARRIWNRSRRLRKWWRKSYLIVPIVELLNFFHRFLTTGRGCLFSLAHSSRHKAEALQGNALHCYITTVGRNCLSTDWSIFPIEWPFNDTVQSFFGSGGKLISLRSQIRIVPFHVLPLRDANGCSGIVC